MHSFIQCWILSPGFHACWTSTLLVLTYIFRSPFKYHNMIPFKIFLRQNLDMIKARLSLNLESSYPHLLIARIIGMNYHADSVAGFFLMAITCLVHLYAIVARATSTGLQKRAVC